jgi:hypothetical protein
MRSFAVIFSGTGWSNCLLHWQLAFGQPQSGHIVPTPVE